MKGIILTPEGKQEIEAKIAELEKIRNESFSDNNDYYLGRIKELKEILSSATILPVEESWYKVIENVENDSQSLILQTPFIMKSLYEQGVIIQSKH
jgi:hypothetical protein